PGNLALGASHPAADPGDSPLAAIPAQLRIGPLLASAHLFPPAVVPAWPGSAARWQPRVQIRRPGDVIGGTPPRAARRQGPRRRRKCIYLAEARPMAVDTSLCTTDRPAGGQKDLELGAAQKPGLYPNTATS